MKVLIVDDDGLNRKYLRVLLMQEGHTVFEANDGMEALEVLEHKRVDAVIADILMPRMDGYRLCHDIRKNPAFNSLPFIAYTATYTSSLDEQVALDFGADRFVSKPAVPEVIIKALHEAVETRGARARPFRKVDELTAMKEYSETLVRKLEETNAELSAANHVLNERAVLAEFNAAISSALNHREPIRVILQLCTDAMVHHLDGALARIWTYNPNDHVLELQASAGMDTDPNAGDARVTADNFEIGLIASEIKPHLTNSMIGDAQVNDQEWAKREGLVAFAGYPLIVEERLVGVMAMFAKKPLSQNTLDAMASVANGIALGIERKLIETELRQSEERFRELAENIREIFFIAGPDGTPVYYVSPAFEEISGRSRKGFENNPEFWLELIHPDDRARVDQAHRAAPERFYSEHRIVRPDGSIRWIHTRSFPVRDDSGTTVRLVGIAEDITERKRAEQAAHQNFERIRALHEIDSAITSTLELPAVLSLLLEKLEIFLPHDAATVRLYNSNTHQLDIVASRNINEQEWTRHSSNPKHPPSPSWIVFDSRKPLAVRNLKNSQTPYDEMFTRQGMISFLGAPLIAKDEVLGVLTLYGREEHDFTGEEVEFLSTVAGQAAIAIYNARLYEQTKRQAGDRLEQERIQRILKELSQDITKMDVDALLAKLTSTIREVFKVDVSDVRFLAGNKWANITVATQNLVQRLPEGGGSLGATDWVVKNRKLIAIEDYQERKEFTPGRVTHMFGVRGFLAAPLLAKNGEVIGVIRALCKEPRNFTAQEIDLFEQFANGAAIAVENERLYIDLERSNKIKSEFLSIMSHELRTPLNVILGYASLAQDDSASAANQQHRHTAQKIEVQARELLDMINSIMDASRIESGAIGITKQKIHVGALFEQLRAAYDPKRQEDIALVWRVPDNLPDLVTDYDKLQRIMRNLIDNAIKFTECGTVTVSAFGEVADLPERTRASSSEGDTPRALQNNIGNANDAIRGTGYVEFAVQDTGIGIADENLPHIFDVFKQVDSSTTRDYGGIGVGLYIAKSFIELLGGQLRVCSEVGKGSTFTVRIPCDS